MSKNYNTEAELLIRIIDIAINCFKNNPPEGFDANHIKHSVNVYLDYKNKVINPLPQFHNLTSLKYIKNDILIFFQEGSGKTVDVFWKEIAKNKIAINRVNRFEKILKRGKIKNHIEYDTVIDLYNSYVETHTITDDQITKINEMILNFEKKASS